MKQNLTIFLNLLCVTLFVTSIIILNKAPLFATFSILWSIFYVIKTNKFLTKIKAFTLIELIAVVAIAGILLSIMFSLKTDTVKRDAQYINSLLMATQSYSYSHSGVHEFELPDNIYNVTEFNSDKSIYFKDGTPVNFDGSLYLDCYVLIYKKDNPDNKYKITINSFTGKRSFY